MTRTRSNHHSMLLTGELGKKLKRLVSREELQDRYVCERIRAARHRKGFHVRHCKDGTVRFYVPGFIVFCRERASWRKEQ